MKMTTVTTPVLPAGARVKTTVHSIKCKYSNGTFNKYKARLCYLNLSPEDNKINKESNDSGKERARSIRVGKK